MNEKYSIGVRCCGRHIVPCLLYAVAVEYRQKRYRAILCFYEAGAAGAHDPFGAGFS